MTRMLAVLATALLAVPAGTALADPFVQNEAAISYADLNLDSADGQVRLASRLDQVARDVCGRGMDRVHPMLAQQAQTCRNEVVAAAREKIDLRLAAAKMPQALAMASK